MMTNDAPLIDSNILLYSANQDSPFYQEAVKILEQYIKSGLYVADINLIEFFQVITDGRKTAEPYSPEKASEFIDRFTEVPSVHVLRSRTLQDILLDETSRLDIANLSITRFGIYDYLIADCMRINQIRTIITGNDKDFKKFKFIQAINPFAKPRTPDLGPRTPDHGFIPYGKQSITEKDVAAVCSVLRSDLITQGPKVPEFEQAVARKVGVKHAVAVNSATSALHLACRALDVGPGDRVWTSPITFVASANCALYCGADVDFVDIDPQTYNMSVQALEMKLQEAERAGRLPKAVIPVHMCGQSCDMASIADLAKRYGFSVIEDAAHAIGGRYRNVPVGSCRYSDIAVFSFHPVKIITTGEGGMAVTNDAVLAEKMELLRSHGITRSPKSDVRTPDHGHRPPDSGPRTPDTGHRSTASGPRTPDTGHRTPDHGPRTTAPGLPAYYYEQIDLGYNCRMTELQAALGLSQLQRLDEFVARRQELAQRYDHLLADLPVSLPKQNLDSSSAWHLYVIRLQLQDIGFSHREIFTYLREQGIGVNVHYIPLHTQPYYQRLGFEWGMLPEAEKYYQEAITLPLFPALSEKEQDLVVETLKTVVRTPESDVRST